MRLPPDHPSADHDQCKWWQESETGSDQSSGTFGRVEGVSSPSYIIKYL